MHPRSASLTAAILLTALPMAASAQDPSPSPADGVDGASYLYVLSGTSTTIDDDAISLEGVPAVIFFSDRPERIAGQLPLARFASAWDTVDDFVADPPNAVLSIPMHDSNLDIVVEITAFSAEDATVDLSVTPLEGTLPTGSFGPGTLFIDDSGAQGAATGSPGILSGNVVLGSLNKPCIGLSANPAGSAEPAALADGQCVEG